MLEWSDFRIILAIAREHTLSGAARRLRLDQSTIGRRLAAIEAAANARLFDRTPAGYALTAAGEAVLPGLEEIEGHAIAVERRLVGQDMRLEGRVKLATSDSLAAWFLVPRLSKLRAVQPGILLEILTGNEPVSLARREADVSLRMTKPEQPNLVARRIGRAAWALYAAESYLEQRGRASMRDGLGGHDIVAFNAALRGTAGAKWLASHAAGGRVVLESNSLITHASAVVAGLGVSPLPCLFGDVQPNLRRMLPETIGHHDVWLVVHPDVKTSSRVRVVMDFLTQLLETEAPLVSGNTPRAPKQNVRRGKARTSERNTTSRAR